MKFLEKLEKTFKFMEGKKTYMVALLLITKALVNYSGNHDVNALIDRSIEAIGLSTLRMGIKR
jgi:hypothetical protein